jgi:hypothetical protein
LTLASCGVSAANVMVWKLSCSLTFSTQTGAYLWPASNFCLYWHCFTPLALVFKLAIILMREINQRTKSRC